MNSYPIKSIPLIFSLSIGALVACSGIAGESQEERVRAHTQALTADAWSSTATYSVNDLVSFEGNVYRCLQTHPAQASWTPTAAPSLWEYVGVDDGTPASTGGA